jgi:hypothetical protein
MIYSVYPVKPETRQLSWFAGFKVYEIEAAPREGYTKCAVEDTIQWIRDTSTFSDDNTNGDLKDAPVSGRQRALDLVNYWTANTVGAKSGYSPGIAIFEGDEKGPEFDQFLEGLRARQRAFFQWMVQDANDRHIRGDGDNITDLHRAAAKWLLDRGAERLPWYPKIEFSDIKNCPACNAQIDKLARKCAACQEDLVDYYLKYDLDATEDPVILAAINRIKSRTAAKTPGPMQPPLAPKPETK